MAEKSIVVKQENTDDALALEEMYVLVISS